MPRRSPYAIVLTADEKAKLESIAQKYTAPYFSVVRAKIVLLADKELSNDQIAAKLDMPRQIVSKWRKRFSRNVWRDCQIIPDPGGLPGFPPRNRGGG